MKRKRSALKKARAAVDKAAAGFIKAGIMKPERIVTRLGGERPKRWEPSHHEPSEGDPCEHCGKPLFWQKVRPNENAATSVTAPSSPQQNQELEIAGVRSANAEDSTAERREPSEICSCLMPFGSVTCFHCGKAVRTLK